MDPQLLKPFLDDPDRPAGTLRYHELQGFLFTVAGAPELVPPSEWLPVIFGEADAGYASLDQAHEILGQIMALYNTINAAVLDPRRCSPRIARYGRPCSPTLRTTRRWLSGPAIHRVLPTAVAQYAHMGRSIATVRTAPDAEAAEPARRARVGRNDLCPCGSGAKYKKCCGATVH